MNQADLLELLNFINETLTATIVITAASMVLYNLSRNVHDRVTRASSAMLACVTVVYAVESISGLGPASPTLEIWYRLQWLGLGFMPASLFHLADALLATTGQPSRGRRRLIVRMLYSFSTLLTALAMLTDLIVDKVAYEPISYMQPGPIFHLYTVYFLVACIVSTWLVWRARERCLTTSTRRRMTLFLVQFLAPGIGIFPYTPFFESFGNGAKLPVLPLTVTFVLANIFVVGMLIFMAYPLSFFGNNKPDRVIKTELLQFLLRGPLTAAVLLAAMVSVPRLSRIWGLESQDFVIVSTITLLLFMQWSITLLLPRLEDLLIFTRDQQEARQLRRVSERMLTKADTTQLLEAILAAVCDQLRAPTAFIASLESGGARLEQVIGNLPDEESIGQELNSLSTQVTDNLTRHQDAYIWRSFWLLPLRPEYDEGSPLGILGIWTQGTPPQLAAEEQERLYSLVNRATKVLTDRQIQTQLFTGLTEFAQSMEEMRRLGDISRYGHIQSAETPIDSAVLIDQVRGALRDLWGGPGLADSRLTQLEVVQKEQANHGGNSVRALQAVLTQAIESLRPPGERSKTTDWILYNILEMRFLQGKKVRDVTQQLFMSEPDFYRKQRIAIEEVARYIYDLEQIEVGQSGSSS